MKNLLVITLLFSTTAFTKINLVCDTSYWFFPDLEYRRLLTIDKTENLVSIVELSWDLMEVTESDFSDLKITNEFYKYGYLHGDKYYVFEINRTTLELKDKWDPLFPKIYQCKKLDNAKYLNAKKKFEKYSQKLKNERKI